MLTLLLRFYRDRFLSRWTVLFFDATATLITLIASIAIRFNFSVDAAQRVLNIYSFTGVLALYCLGFILIGSYKGILRHTSLDDVKNVLRASTSGLILSLGVTAILILLGLGRLFPVSILSFHYALTTLALIGLRLVAKSIYIAGTQTKSDTVNLLIFGCGDSGIMTKNAFQQEQNGKFKVVGFLDDNANRWGKQLQDIQIHAPKLALTEEWVKKHNIHQLVIAIQGLSPIPKSRNQRSGNCFRARSKSGSSLQKVG